jgi:hypothetical protein
MDINGWIDRWRETHIECMQQSSSKKSAVPTAHTCHAMSHVSCHVAHIILCRMSHGMSHISCYVCCVARIMSHRTYHVTSHVSCHIECIMSYRTYHVTQHIYSPTKLLSPCTADINDDPTLACRLIPVVLPSALLPCLLLPVSDPSPSNSKPDFARLCGWGGVAADPRRSLCVEAGPGDESNPNC